LHPLHRSSGDAYVGHIVSVIVRVDNRVDSRIYNASIRCDQRTDGQVPVRMRPNPTAPASIKSHLIVRCRSPPRLILCFILFSRSLLSARKSSEIVHRRNRFDADDKPGPFVR